MFTAFYLRVSTAEQSTENQAIELRTAGYEATATFTEEGVSGKVRAIERPAFSDMMRTFDRISDSQRKRLVVTKIDRLGRDAEDVLATIRLLKGAGVEVFVLQLGQVDLSSTMGKLVLTVLSGVADMERDLIVERTLAGLARARADGKQLGRPKALDEAQRVAVKTALDQQVSVNSLAKKFGVSRGTIRALRAA